jgi:hypothetical protein
MQRRYAEYRPSRRPRLGRRYGLFRSASLNAVGWAAVTALCLAGAAVGYGVGLLIGWPVAWMVIGALLSLVALVVADRRQWGRIWTGYSWGGSPETTERVATELKRQGLPVETEMYPDGQARLHFRHRDGRRVALALSQLGIRPPGGYGVRRSA